MFVSFVGFFFFSPFFWFFFTILIMIILRMISIKIYVITDYVNYGLCFWQYPTYYICVDSNTNNCVFFPFSLFGEKLLLVCNTIRNLTLFLTFLGIFFIEVYKFVLQLTNSYCCSCLKIIIPILFRIHSIFDNTLLYNKIKTSIW